MAIEASSEMKSHQSPATSPFPQSLFHPLQVVALTLPDQLKLPRVVAEPSNLRKMENSQRAPPFRCRISSPGAHGPNWMNDPRLNHSFHTLMHWQNEIRSSLMLQSLIDD